MYDGEGKKTVETNKIGAQIVVVIGKSLLEKDGEQKKGKKDEIK